MARIPVERNTGGGGAWWWVLVIAVVGLVVWLVYEWFDDDYYEDYGYADDAGATLDPYGATPYDVEQPYGPGAGGPAADDTLGAERVYPSDPGAGQGMYGQSPYGDPSATGDTDAPSGTAAAPGASSAALTSLGPLTTDDWRSYVDRDVQLDGITVARTEGERAFSIDANGEDVLVVVDEGALQGTDGGSSLQVGQSLRIVDGTVEALDDPRQLERFGLDPGQLQDEQYYIHAQRIQVTG